jgi:hypothetical protein
MKAGKYYDSAVIFPRSEISRLSGNKNQITKSECPCFAVENYSERRQPAKSVARMTEPERNALIASIIAKIVKIKVKGKVQLTQTGIISGSTMRMKDVFRAILTRKENGIFIIRLH